MQCDKEGVLIAVKNSYKSSECTTDILINIEHDVLVKVDMIDEKFIYMQPNDKARNINANSQKLKLNITKVPK